MCAKQAGNAGDAWSLHEQYVRYQDSLSLVKDKLAVVRVAIQSENDQRLHDAQLENGKNRAAWEVRHLKQVFASMLIGGLSIAAQAHLSVDGIGSALCRMYQLFDIKESRHMKFALLMEAIKISTRWGPGPPVSSISRWPSGGAGGSGGTTGRESGLFTQGRDASTDRNTDVCAFTIKRNRR